MLSLCSVLNFFDKQSGKPMTYVLDLQESIPLPIFQNVVDRLMPIHMQSYEFFAVIVRLIPPYFTNVFIKAAIKNLRRNA